MNVLSIPMSSTAPWFAQQMTLTGASYTLEFVFNVRGMMWMMSIADASGSPLACNVPLLIGRNLTSVYSDVRMPSGYFVCLDMTGQGQEAGLSSFATTHKLFFVET